MKRIITIFLLIFKVSLSFVSAKDYRPEDIENPNIENRSRYVADPGSLVSPEALRQADNILWDLRQKTSAEVVVAVVPSIGDIPIEDFATRLFTEWGIGKKDKDNGVLVVIVPEQRTARIATGYGVEGIIPDIAARKIIQRSIVPFMRDNNLDGAVTTVSSDIAKVLTDPTAADELRSQAKESWEGMPESDITTEEIIMLAISVIIIVFLVSLGMYFYDNRNLKRKDRYQQAIEWHERKNYYLYLSILSLGLGLIPYFLVLRKYNLTRNKPMDCPTCKAKMRKLNEEEDNALLSPSQDFEEKINSVDYDVWVCPDCGTVEKFPFRNNKANYEECPICHTRAMTMVRNHTLKPSTTTSFGIGERIYECKYCHNNIHRRYTIPKKADAAAAGIIAGSILGSRGGGGGFGGGFGGGSTGGGGASGRW